jgi:hypothetical protein
MNRKAYGICFAGVCLSLAFAVGCGGGSGSSKPPSTPPAAQVVGITLTSGSTQTAATGKSFGSHLTVTVTTSGIPTGGETVTFTAPTSGASGTFANGTSTETDVTDNNGLATSSAFTANGTGGAYTVTAAVAGAPTPINFDLTNIPATSYSFYLSGYEVATGWYYAVAGSVVIDSAGNVLGGEQDYNDGGFGFASPQPGGDRITGGKLSFPAGAPAGQGTLTLNTSNLSLGNNADGVEVFGVQFVNSSHALIMQFDGFSTSSGSFDLQTLPSTLSGGYAFALSGFDSADAPMSFGGVFSISGGTLSNGVLDVNDSFNLGVTTGTAFTGTVSAPDSFGRGTITGIRAGGSRITLRYYIVGPEAIRLVDVDPADSALGSAFGQGSAPFTNASLGASVFTLAGTQLAQFGAVGQFTTDATATPATLAGVGEDNEPLNSVVSLHSASLSGTYSIASNGYGSLGFDTVVSRYPGFGDITALGIYMTDPALNLNDPNNPTGGGGGLVVGLDGGLVTGIPLPGGTGMIIPQTDTATASFNGNYAAGWSNLSLNCGCEFDMIAQGAMTPGGALTLTGLVSDPAFSLGTPDATSSSDTFNGTPVADVQHPGRYSLVGGKLASAIDGATGPNFNMLIFQASGSQLFWLDYDPNLTSVSVGSLEQQGSLTALGAARKSAPKKLTGRRR